MTRALAVAIIFLGLGGFTTGLRRKSKRASFTVNCTLEMIASITKDREPIEGLVEDFAECTTPAGAMYSVAEDDVDDFEDGDFVSLELTSAQGHTADGYQLYKAVSVSLLRARTVPSLASVDSSAFSMIGVRVVYQDKSGPEMSSIEKGVEEVRKVWKSASFGTFLPTAKLTTLVMPERWQDAKKDCGAARKRLLAQLPAADQYTYRLFFLPRADACWPGVGGVAKMKCGRPQDAPTKGICWSLYWYEDWFTQAHEVGHNFGLHHAGREGRAGAFSDYGDHRSVMGNSWSPKAHYSVSDRFQLGWATEGYDGEVLAPRPRQRYILNPLEKAVKGLRVGLRFACEACKPIAERPKVNGVPHIYVSYVHGEVFVHLERSPGKGTELWAVLQKGQAWQNPYGPQAVRLCDIESRGAQIGHGETVKGAAFNCGGFFIPGGRKCGSRKKVSASATCREAAGLIGKPFAGEVSSMTKAEGCFEDQGKFFFNKLQPSAATSGFSVCQQPGWW